MTERIPEKPTHRLGRHVEHDPRSLQHPIETTGVTLRKITHGRVGSIFDQGALGSCTGNAVAGACNTRPTYKQGAHVILEESDAVKAYEVATQLDGFPWVFPPDDFGSSGLAACKAAKQLGWITSYKWAFTTQAALEALMARPVIVGVNWYEGFDHPKLPTGLVQIAGGVRGGHEFVIRGYEPAATTGKSLVWADNSWSNLWGKAGRFCFTVDTLDQLLHEQGDCTIPIR